MFALPIRGYHPLRPCFPDRFWLSHIHDWPGPRSLATTSGVSVDVLSSRYLDVSVPWVCLKPPMYSEVSYLLLITGNPKPHGLGFSQSPDQTPRPRLLNLRGLGVPAIEGGFPHSEIRGSKLLRSSPRFFVVLFVLFCFFVPWFLLFSFLV